MTFLASAPGSIMLTGEHAVLYKQAALVGAIDKRIKVSLTPRQDKVLHLHAPPFGKHTTSIDSITRIKPFEFALASFKPWQSQLKTGADVFIESEFEPTLGLGSSAAVVVALQQALAAWLTPTLTKAQIFEQARAVIRDIQGLGSGADVAASVYGGVVYYQLQPFTIEVSSIQPPLALIYSGTKTPTPEVVTQVAARYQQYPTLYDKCFQLMHDCTQSAWQAIQQQDWLRLGELFQFHYGLQWAIGVSTPHLQRLIDILNQCPSIMGSKISGSGMGDCVVAVGEMQQNDNFIDDALTQVGVKPIPVQISLNGVCCE